MDIFEYTRVQSSHGPVADICRCRSSILLPDITPQQLAIMLFALSQKYCPYLWCGGAKMRLTAPMHICKLRCSLREFELDAILCILIHPGRGPPFMTRVEYSTICRHMVTATADVSGFFFLEVSDLFLSSHEEKPKKCARRGSHSLDLS